MATLQKVEALSAAHCFLLAVHYATESDIDRLRVLTALRKEDLGMQTWLRIVLSYLPESDEPSTYIEYLDELVNDSPDSPDPDLIETAFVEEFSSSQARRKQKKVELLPLVHPFYRAETDVDSLTQFLIHRAHRIDDQTGLLELVPRLVVPFLAHSEHLRTWFISTVLPLLRLGYEYYPQSETPSLDEFVRLTGRHAVNTQLSKVDPDHAVRDIKGVISPWMCGANERKRRKLSREDRRASITDKSPTEHEDWECLFDWLVCTTSENLPLAAAAMNGWDGPEDMDLGGYDEGRDYVDDELQRRLELRYAQTILTCLYLVPNSSTESITTAHALLVRLTDLLGIEKPSDLSLAANALPSYDLPEAELAHVTTPALQNEQLPRADNLITQPQQNNIRLLELFLFSIFVMSSLQYPLSIRDAARLYARIDASEQVSLLQKLVHALSSGGKRDTEQWLGIRAKLLWLWNWGSNASKGEHHAQGLLGQIPLETLETEILKGLLEGSHYQLAAQIYVPKHPAHPPLALPVVERTVLEAAMHHYDNASNGNRTRGGMKRASDIVAAFKSSFPDSRRFQRMEALLSATHAMSFYSLKLAHGVPFQPVNIRVSNDPLSFIPRLLSQNSTSYTRLDDMISIGQNLVVAMPSTIMDDSDPVFKLTQAAIEKKKETAERRVIGMTVEAALQENDFETAYSYVVNRLNPQTPSPLPSPSASLSSERFSFGSHESAGEEDGEDVAWRAALQAGRHSASPSSSSIWGPSSTIARPDLRRLEQRMELLSQALLLAPPRHLEEVLAVWQECETELTNVLANEDEAEARFNDAADRKLPGAFANDTIAVQPRREVGRGAGEEAPMGLFDVARGAAAAFSKTAFPLRGGRRNVSGAESNDMGDSGRQSMDMSETESTGGNEDRVRRRDMVANAVTGGLASGIGWVLGATPTPQRDRE